MTQDTADELQLRALAIMREAIVALPTAYWTLHYLDDPAVFARGGAVILSVQTRNTDDMSAYAAHFSEGIHEAPKVRRGIASIKIIVDGLLIDLYSPVDVSNSERRNGNE